MTQSRATVTLGWMLWLLLPMAALAQAEPQSYEQSIRQAVEEYSLGHWTEARFFFARAHAVNPNARTLRGLGLSCYESRHYVESLAYLEAALNSPVQPLTAAMHDDVEQTIVQASESVGRVWLELEPADARASIDSAAAQRGPQNEILVDPGDHDLQLSAAGIEPVTRAIRVASGQDVRLQLRLQKATRARPALNAQLAPRPALATRAAESGIASSVVLGAGAVMAVAGGIFVGVALADKASVEHPGDRTTWSDVQSPYRRGRTFFPLGFVLAGAGLAGIATGLTWKLWPASGERERQVTLRASPFGVQLDGRL